VKTGQGSAKGLSTIELETEADMAGVDAAIFQKYAWTPNRTSRVEGAGQNGYSLERKTALANTIETNETTPIRCV